MEAIKRAVNDAFAPVYFAIRNEQAAGPWNTDQNFYGVLCSPKFEGKSRTEMVEMVKTALEPLGMADRCRFAVEPPSKWARLYRKKRWRWGVDS
jgi:stress-induced morphogen